MKPDNDLFTFFIASICLTPCDAIQRQSYLMLALAATGGQFLVIGKRGCFFGVFCYTFFQHGSIFNVNIIADSTRLPGWRNVGGNREMRDGVHQNFRTVLR